MSDLVKNIIRFSLFILAQVFVLNHVPPLHHLVTPYLYFLFILWLPFKMGRRSVMILAFLLGFCLDSFTKTYGLHAAPCVLIAYLRPFLINLLISQEGAETNYNEPSIKSMGFAQYFIYAAVLTFIHHFAPVLFGGIANRRVFLFYIENFIVYGRKPLINIIDRTIIREKAKI